MSLRAFEAAARHQSFTRAAAELNLTQTAISHQIKNLEDLLSVPLFVRERNAVRLTDVGHEYLASVRAAITQITAATDRALDTNRGNVLTVACLTAFAVKCLIPHLKDFRRRHPDIQLRIGTVVSFDLLQHHDYDVAIRYGTGEWRGWVAHKIAPEEVFPVCSPRLLKSGPKLRHPADLRQHTVIRTSSFALQDEWPIWLEQAGIPDLEFADEITCDLLFPSIQAAVDGLGVVMGRTAVISADLASGLLVEPFSIRLPTTAGYHVVSSAERADMPMVRVFRDWVLSRLQVSGANVFTSARKTGFAETSMPLKS
jgi:LysR family glycine cleavage system transcriptional activator